MGGSPSWSRDDSFHAPHVGSESTSRGLSPGYRFRNWSISPRSTVKSENRSHLTLILSTFASKARAFLRFLSHVQTWNRILIQLRKYNYMNQPFDLFKSMSVTWFSPVPECRSSNSGYRILQQGCRIKVPIWLEKRSPLQPSKRLPFGKYPSSISGCFDVSPLDRQIRWANISPADLHMVTRYLSATFISLEISVSRLHLRVSSIVYGDPTSIEAGKY